MENGERLGHYEILRLLGKGGMGDVYLARDRRLGRKIALKRLPPQWVGTPEVLRRFQREARLAAALNHPNIVTLYSVESEGDVHFLTMEFVEGESLAGEIPAGGMDLRRFLHIAVSLASALEASHRLGIAHRDLKPHNIMMTPDGRVKVLDFGIARRFGTGGADGLEEGTTTLQTDVGFAVGTVPYMSPEQARGQTVDARTDLFSLGIVFYEMLTGTRPFGGANRTEMLAAILRDSPPTLASRRPDVPAHLEAIVNRCLQKRPEARYAHTVDLVRELHEVTQEAAQGRFRAPAAVTPAPAPHTLAVLDFVNITRDPVVDWLGTGIVETLTTDLRKLQSLAVTGREAIQAALRVHANRPLAAPDPAGPATSVELGRVLGVDWVVAGAFQTSGRTLRITVQCVDVHAAAIVDAVKLDGSLDDIFVLQDRLVQELVRIMRLEVADPGNELAPSRAPGIAAFECFARARQHIEQMNRESFDQARSLLERAVALAPDYALAHSGLGQLYAMTFIATTDTQDLGAAIRHLQRAVELDPRISEAHAHLCYCYMRSWRFAEAVAAGEEAVRLGPENWRAWYFLGLARVVRAATEFRPALLDRGAESLAESLRLRPDFQPAAQLLGHARLLQGDYARAGPALEQAAAIEGSSSGGVQRFVGAHCLLAQLRACEGDTAGALSLFERSLALVSPNLHVYASAVRAASHRGKGHVRLCQGENVEAVGEFRRGLEIVLANPRALGLGWIAVRLYLGLAMSLGRLDMQTDASQCLEEATDLLRQRQRFDFSYIWEATEADIGLDLARYHALAGRLDEAMGCLRRALECGWSDPHVLDRDPLLDGLRRQAAFASLRATLAGR